MPFESRAKKLPLRTEMSSVVVEAGVVRPKKHHGWFVLVVVVLTMIGGGAFWWWNTSRGTPEDIIVSLSKTNEKSALQAEMNYHAVFLDNGQVYFGKLKQTGSDFYHLEDVFYFKQNPVPSPSQANAKEKKEPPATSLAKLGGEAHGPTDSMDLNKQHILFIELLRSDSQVVQAIADYYSKKQE